MSGTTQNAFASALLDPGGPMPAGLVAWNGPDPERRFAVYRNNVVVGLIGAITSRFPATERIVGEDFFRAMARHYVLNNPPRSPVLLAYGDDFADFIAAFEPAGQVPYLADVARLEVARGRAYHAADRPALDPRALAAIAADRLADLRFAAHPSVSIVRSAHPMVTIWAMNAGEAPLAAIADWRGEDALVVRPGLEVLVHRLPPGGAEFVDALLAGQTLGAAVEAASATAAGFDLAANLAGALSAGAFTTLDLSNEDDTNE